MQDERIPFVPFHMEQEPLPTMSFREVYYLHQM
jgi:hypothetical protein